MKPGLSFSAQSWTRVFVLTILGTAFCIAGALAFDSYSFNEARWRWGVAPWNNVIIPLLLAPPFFFLMLMKLRELAIANERLLQIASTDGLTACLSRAAFTTLVDAYLDRFSRSVDEGGLLVIDVDFFKKVNDEFGHDAGDQALKLIADRIRSSLREVDLVGRMGGEEFAVFLPGASSGRTAAVAERIRASITRSDFCPGGVPCRLSISVGAVTFGKDASFTILYKFADEKLYSAKRKGRNRVEILHLKTASRHIDH